jgi:hypothetical protein
MNSCAAGLGFSKLSPQYCLSDVSTTLTKNTRFRVIHVFHPLAGREFTLVIYRQHWSEERVFFYNDEGVLSSLPAQWTSLFPEDPLVSLPATNVLFRAPDLLELTQLIQTISVTTNWNQNLTNGACDV